MLKLWVNKIFQEIIKIIFSLNIYETPFAHLAYFDASAVKDQKIEMRGF